MVTDKVASATVATVPTYATTLATAITKSSHQQQVLFLTHM